MTENDDQKNEKRPPDQGISRKKWIIDNVVSLGVALLIVFMIRSSVVEAFKIPSGSMIPTLFIGDHIFVNKFAYGLKVPFSDLIMDRPLYVVNREGPKRGDIIVFLFPKDESTHYIKRVVGVPGDVIEVRKKVLYINQKAQERVLVPSPESDKLLGTLEDPRYSSGNVDLFQEKIDSVEHPILIDKNGYMNEDFGPRTVPSDIFFVMGDNRDFSNDSRFWGFVPFRNVKGKAMVIWLSIWLNFSDSQFAFRPGRIGTILR